MKDKIKVISRKNLPARPPVLLTAVVYLFLDKFQASGVVWGVVFTILALFWIAWIIALFKEEDINIFEQPDLTYSLFGSYIDSRK